MSGSRRQRTEAPRRPVPRPVRIALARALDLLERRTRRGRATAPPLPDGGRLRVTFLLRSCYGIGGTNRTVINTANQLAELGHAVELVSLLRPRPAPAFPVDPRVRLTALLEERTRTVVADPDSRLVSWLARRRLAGVARVLDGRASVLAGTDSSPRLSLLTDLLMLAKIRSLPPGVLVLTRPLLITAGARFAAPAVRTIGQEHWTFRSRSAKTRRRLLVHYRKLDALTVLTPPDAHRYRRALDGSGVEVRTMPNGVPRYDGPLSDPSSTVVVSAGRLAREKGFDLLVPAFRQVAERHPDWQLRIFGAGPEHERLRDQIAALGVGRNVRLMGATTRMAEEMAAGAVYALSSRLEPFGMVIIEALNVGLPVVSFDCPTGPREILTDGVDGVLVPAADVDALAEALSALIEDPDRRRSMSAAARTTAERYSLEHIGELWEQLLRDVATAPRH